MEKTTEKLRALFAVAVPRHSRVALCFSGGKESLLLAHALRPWQDRVDLVTVNTGATFPHMELFIRKAAEGFKFVELRSNQPAHIAAHGWPSRIIPIRHTSALRALAGRKHPDKLEERPRTEYEASTRGALIQDSIACCMTLRQQPLNNYMVAERVGLLIHGVRAGDGAAISTAFGPCEVLAPLWDWTEAEVFAEIEAQGIELPEHYNEVTSSLDCWNCTAEVSPARFAWMRRRYPKLADALAPVMAANLEASGALLRDYQDALRAITGEAAHA